jgi:hypothetical protein
MNVNASRIRSVDPEPGGFASACVILPTTGRIVIHAWWLAPILAKWATHLVELSFGPETAIVL